MSQKSINRAILGYSSSVSLCIPNKMNGWAKHRVLGHHGFGKLRREAVAQDQLKEIDS